MMQENLILGILAHVDAGKTTLSEALLHLTGAVRNAGSVDHGNAFLDTDVMEKERGITMPQVLIMFRYMENFASPLPRMIPEQTGI